MIKNKFPDTKPSLNLDFINSKTLDARITFERGSPARYYDGKTTHVTSQNLVEYSQNFEPGYWYKGSVNVVHNTTTAPDGTETACLVYNHDTNEYGGSGNMYINTQFSVLADSLTHDTYTYSIYAKRAGRDYLIMSLFDHNTDYSASGTILGQQGQYVFDLRNGIIVDYSTDPNSLTVASIESAGDDWYRCIVTAKGASTACWFYSVNSEFKMNEPNVAGETTGVHLWGAQIEKRDRCTPYTPTDGAMITRRANTLVTAAPDQPRFDHDPITNKPLGLLIEEQVTNMLKSSDNPVMDQDTWNTLFGGITTVPTVAIGPDGGYVHKTVAASGDGTRDDHHQLYQALNLTDALPHTFSVYAKAVEVTHVGVVEASITGAAGVFNLSDGTLHSSNPGNASNQLTGVDFENLCKIEPVGDDWYRISMTFWPTEDSISSSSSDCNFSLYLYGPDGGQLIGDDISGVYFWGAQVERMPFATSYTSSDTHAYTRKVDSATISEFDFDWYNPTQGTMLAEASDIDVGIHDQTAGSNSNQRHCVFAFSTEPDKNYNFMGIGKTLGGGYKDMLTVSAFSTQQLVTYYESIKILNAVTPGVTYKTGLSYINNTVTGVYNGQIHESGGPDEIGGIGGKSSDSDDDLMDLTSRFNRLGIGQRQNRNDNNLNGHIKRLTYYPTCLTNEQIQTLTS